MSDKCCNNNCRQGRDCPARGWRKRQIGEHKTVSLVRLYRDKDGVIIHSEEAEDVETLEMENKLLRARNERLEREAKERGVSL
jgi:hypothetical protein